MPPLMFALSWPTVEGTAPNDEGPHDEDAGNDEGGGPPAAVQPERPVRWPPRVRLFLPPALPVPCPAIRGG